MATTGKQLVSATAPSPAGVIYTAPATGPTRIDALTILNTSGAAHTVSLWLTGSGGAGTSNQVLANYSLAANASYVVREAIGHWLNTGGTITAVSDTAGVVAVVASGIEVS